jgi:prolyl-tRNA synthetase
MYDGIALQNGTTHYFGTNFSKVFDIKFLNETNELTYPHQTSWGVSTRMIGGLIMVHSDDNGLVLPPKLAPFKVVIIPIGTVEKELDLLKRDLLENNITFKIDNTNKSPGYKFSDAEVKGYPVRIELGERDLTTNEVTLVRRDTLEKIKIPFGDLIKTLNDLLEDIQNNLYKKALKRRNEMLHVTNDYEEFKKIAVSKPGFIKVNWCGHDECEVKIKDETTLKSRCIIEDEVADGNCIVCEKTAKHKIYFGKQY